MRYSAAATRCNQHPGYVGYAAALRTCFGGGYSSYIIDKLNLFEYICILLSFILFVAWMAQVHLRDARRAPGYIATCPNNFLALQAAKNGCLGQEVAGTKFPYTRLHFLGFPQI